jgi:pyruvate dehydrogenase E1 component alpha subunit
MNDKFSEAGEAKGVPPVASDEDVCVELYRIMLRIRLFELEVRRLFAAGELPGFVHLSVGQEAIAAGACSVLKPSDCITSTHRGHGHVIARGAGLGAMMAEILGKRDGCCRGKGGSMHIADVSLGILGANGIVGAGLPLATGAALASKTLGAETVTVCFFGDGAANQGVFLESLNLSAIWQLPVIFICENNQYTEWMRTETITAGDIYRRGEPFNIPSDVIDGNDVLAVREAVGGAVARARAGGGPSLIEATTYRHYGHNEGEEVFSGVYRPEAEIAAWKARDPLERLRARLQRVATRLDAIADEESAVVRKAVEAAKASPLPDRREALTDLFVAP